MLLVFRDLPRSFEPYIIIVKLLPTFFLFTLFFFLRGKNRGVDGFFRDLVYTDKVKVNIYLLFSIDAILCVALMNDDPLDKFVEHGGRHILKILVAVYQFDESGGFVIAVRETVNRRLEFGDLLLELSLLALILICGIANPFCQAHRLVVLFGIGIFIDIIIADNGICSPSFISGLSICAANGFPACFIRH